MTKRPLIHSLLTLALIVTAAFPLPFPFPLHAANSAQSSAQNPDVPEGYPANYARAPRFKALVYYTENAEQAHVEFSHRGVEFFKRLNYGDGFVLDVTSDLSAYPYERLREYSVVVMLDGYPSAPAERAAFERYMESGGGWVGFHVAAYNDRNTHWPWLVQFLGGGVFYCNNWPPQPALVALDTAGHPVTRNLPQSFVAAETEWYQWTPSPRENPDVEVLVTLSPLNYPFGIKDVVSHGDWPVVWSNKKYRMIYLNMGHSAESFGNSTQDLLFVNAFRWVVSRDPAGDPFLK